MIVLIICGIALALGILVGLLVVRDTGYVLIAYGNTTIETSVWAVLILLFLLLLILYFGTRLLWRVLNGRSTINLRRTKKQRDRTLNDVATAIFQSEVGFGGSSIELLKRTATTSDAGPLVLLEAARVASSRGQVERSTALLEQLRSEYPQLGDVVDVVEAEAAVNAGSASAALPQLRQLIERQPRSVHGHQVLIRALDQSADWAAVQDSMDRLRKLDASAAEELFSIEENSWIERFKALQPSSVSLESMQKLWNTVPKHQHRNEPVVMAYVSALVASDNRKEAVATLRASLRSEWQEKLIEAYGLIVDNAGEQLKQAEQWLKVRGNDATLLLTLGRLSLAVDREEQARDYFEQSIRISASSPAREELARLFLKQKDFERSLTVLESKSLLA